MRRLTYFVCTWAVALLTACGGGGGGGSLYTSAPASDSGGATTTAATVEVLSSSTSVGTGGETVTITAVVKNASNVGLSAAPVAFSTTSGTLSSASSTTNSAGVATATFAAGGNKANRSATIQVTSGTATGQLVVPIIGSKLSISGATSVPFGQTATLTVKATDSSGAAILGLPITFSSSLGNGLSATGGNTDSAGSLSVTYTATAAGTDSFTASGGGTSSTSSLSISGEDFTFVTPTAATQIAVGASQVIRVRYRQGGVGVAGQAVNFSSTGGTIAANGSTIACTTPLATCAVTDASGVATVSISSTSAAAATLQASLASSSSASTSTNVAFIATVPSRLVLQVSPSAIGVNASGTTNQAQVVARVFDANGNPVPNLSVNFSRDADPSGGNLQQASATTDLNGQASVQYIAGANATSSGGVVLRATVASATTVTGTTTMTVNQQALFIALGTGNTISNFDNQTYQKQWTAYVTDANGVAVQNVRLTIRVLPVVYRKGVLEWVADPGVWRALLWDGLTLGPNGRLPDGAYINCGNEDAFFGDSDARSYNGVLNAGEDLNGDGLLQPGNVVSVVEGSLTTDSAGRATITLRYAESYVPWMVVRLDVQGVVSGTAGATYATFSVPGVSDDFTDQNNPPAGVVSPFGVATTCSNPN